MPKRRKISIEDAFAALHHQHEKMISLPADDPIQIYEVDEKVSPPVKAVSPTMVEIILYCQHSIGIGQQYGPGKVRVSSDIAAGLLHQDQYARKVDERVLNSKQQMYQIMPVASADGGLRYRGVAVDDLDFTSLFYNADRSLGHFKF
jgi:hypothetical protein